MIVIAWCFEFDDDNIGLMSRFAQTRFGIYLIHPLWIMILMGMLQGRGLAFGLQLLITSIGSVLASYVTVYAVQQLPGGTTIMPKS